MRHYMLLSLKSASRGRLRCVIRMQLPCSDNLFAVPSLTCGETAGLAYVGFATARPRDSRLPKQACSAEVCLTRHRSKPTGGKTTVHDYAALDAETGRSSVPLSGHPTDRRSKLRRPGNLP